MKLLWNRLLIAACLVVMLAVWPPLFGATRDDRPYEVRADFEIDPPSPVVGAPIQIRLILRNLGDRGLAVDLGPHREAALWFEMVSPSGEVTSGQWELRNGPALPGKLYLEPGAEHVHKVNLGRWLSVGRAGRYEITAGIEAPVLKEGKRQGPFYLGGSKVGELETEEVLTIEVEDDPERAAEICSRFAERAKSRDAQVAIPALEALTFASSPACLPALGEVVLNGYQAPHLALQTIERIGGIEAVEVLVTLLNRVDGDSAAEIAATLRGFCGEYGERVSPALEEAGFSGCEPGSGREERWVSLTVLLATPWSGFEDFREVFLRKGSGASGW